MYNPERVTYFAATDSRGKKTPFGIKAKDRERHMYVIGKTGMGKSTLLENMAIQDIRNGEGMAFIDPHGSAVDKLLDYIPEERIKDVVYFAPFDLDCPIAFNVMEDVGYDKRHLVVSGLMATFKKIWLDAWSARMEYILSNTILALLEYPGATLLGVNRMYTDKAYRKKVVENVKDPLVKDFWVKEFATYTDRYTQEATPAIQNKIGQFTSNPLIRNIIGQSKSSFDIRTLMDQKKILLINLSKGLVGDTNMKLLGSMITTRIFLAAMSRAELAEKELKASAKFYFYVDEFQNFANDTFAEILSEARKYNLNLLIAHQYVEQMEEQVRAAVFGNVGTTVAFRVGPFDAEVLETIFFPEFTKEDLVNLGFAQVYMTLMIDGIGSRPFSAVTIPPIEKPPQVFRKEVLEASRAAFANPRADVEGAIMAELAASGLDVAAGEPEPQKRRFADRPSSEAPRDRRPLPPRDSAPPARPTFSQPPRPPERYENRPQPQAVSREPMQRPPPAPEKTADDLKSILRAVTAKTGEAKEKKEVTQQQSLKSALADVLAKSAPPPKAPLQAKSPAPQSTPPAPRPETATAPQKPATPQPFEVSEEHLRKILKGEA
ncbi:MAG TPA: type IV secretion system DNA-binding domain-containing protein [Candidatus Paceibacterota bacterium]|nr:type IV secretion system DNA-binding domain-containing protein [Candidatus Paceibacterota bacterium]